MSFRLDNNGRSFHFWGRDIATSSVSSVKKVDTFGKKLIEFLLFISALSAIFFALVSNTDYLIQSILGLAFGGVVYFIFLRKEDVCCIEIRLNSGEKYESGELKIENAQKIIDSIKKII